MSYVIDTEFKYNDQYDYDTNFMIWRDLNDYERKCDQLPYRTEAEAMEIYQKQWGYKKTARPVKVGVSRLSA